MEKMAVEEQEAMEECWMAAKQRVRWADMEEGQKRGEKRKNWQVTAAEENRPGGERDEMREEEKQETGGSLSRCLSLLRDRPVA